MFWLNGRYFEDDRPHQFSIRDRGFLLADGLFETILIRHGQPMFLGQHFDRLEESAAGLAIPLPDSCAEVGEIIATLIKQKQHGSVRMTLTRGEGPRGLLPPVPEETTPSRLLTFAPSDAPLSAFSTTPVRAVISSIRRNESSPASRMKTLAYTDNLLARREAEARGAQEALMLNMAGNPVSATIANLFVILPGDRLATPPPGAGCLPGITRYILLQIARQAGIDCLEEEVSLKSLETGYAFLTNSLTGLRPVQLAGSPAKPAPAGEALFNHLAALYSQYLDRQLEELHARI